MKTKLGRGQNKPDYKEEGKTRHMNSAQMQSGSTAVSQGKLRNPKANLLSL